MRHLKGYRKLGRETSHRMAMLRNMATSLLEHERIETTLPKAKELRGVVEKVITMGKNGSLHNRRKALAIVYKDDVVKKVFGEIAVRFKDRPGGYTRILRKGPRFGDGAEMALIELVDFEGKKTSEATK